jgi:hypothetical protein
MVKIRCPVCNGTGRVSSSFGNPYPYPYVYPVWYGNTWTTNSQSQTANSAGGCQTNWHVPSTTTTYINYPCEKTCPACGGTGLQECDHNCHCCCHHPHHDHCCEKRKYPYRRVIEKPPCPNPYIPYTSSTGSTVPGSYTITVSMNDNTPSKKRPKIDEL